MLDLSSKELSLLMNSLVETRHSKEHAHLTECNALIDKLLEYSYGRKAEAGSAVFSKQQA